MKTVILLTENNQLIIKKSQHNHVIEIADIIDVVYDKPYVVINTPQKRIVTYTSLKKVINSLNENFIRCNKATIINKQHIKAYDKKKGIIKLKTGKEYIASIRQRSKIAAII